MLVIKTDLIWEYLPYLCAKYFGFTKNEFCSQNMVFGNQGSKSPNFDTEPLTHIHPRVLNIRQRIEKKKKKSFSKNTFKYNDYVFVLDRYSTPYNIRLLKTRFSLKFVFCN
jgi:hypothetical protein